MIIDKATAISSLVSGAEYVINIAGEVTWINPTAAPVTDAQIETELARLQADYATKEYQRKRAAEYPPMADYLDAIVKGDTQQQEAYIAACLAVKAKYPK